jgi:hypothetical protein
VIVSVVATEEGTAQMSETRGNGADTAVISLADRLYPGGPISGPGDSRAREIIDGGQARPDPRFVDEPGKAGQLFGSAERSRGPEPTFDPSRYTAPEGYEAHPQMMREFAGLAKEVGLSHRGGERMLELFTRATDFNNEAYARRLADGAEQLSRELDPEHLATAKALIADPQITPPALRPWIETWGSHPLLAKWIVNLAGMIRNGGRY